jgi:hypothetical protein
MVLGTKPGDFAIRASTGDAVIAAPTGHVLLNPMSGNNVGIGTTAPTSKLHVAGTLAVTGNIRAPGAGVNTNTAAFKHQATAGNTSGHITTIDNAQCNGDPNAILIVTQNWNPNGGVGVYNAHEVGIYYDGDNRWKIFNQDSAAMPANAGFNVLVIKN